jgi:hypothetical protein
LVLYARVRHSGTSIHIITCLGKSLESLLGGEKRNCEPVSFLRLVCCTFFSRNAYRSTSAEKKALDKLQISQVQELREAAEVHRTVRGDVRAHTCSLCAYVRTRMSKTNRVCATLSVPFPRNVGCRSFLDSKSCLDCEGSRTTRTVVYILYIYMYVYIYIYIYIYIYKHKYNYTRMNESNVSSSVYVYVLLYVAELDREHLYAP